MSKLSAVEPLWLNYGLLSREPYAHIYLGIWLFGPPWGPEGGENIGKPSYFNLPPDIGFTLFTPIKGRMCCTTIMAQFSSTSGLQYSLTYMYYTSKCLYMSLLYKYIQ
jgi:hypothetical protein